MHLFHQEEPCLRRLGVVVERKLPIDLNVRVVPGRYDFAGVRLGLGVVFGSHVVMVLPIEGYQDILDKGENT